MTSESSKNEATEKPLCFVIGPIGKEATDVRKHSDLLLHAVVRHVLEQGEFNYLVKRADEDTDPGMVSDRVIADIMRAELVVADLTELNPNVFYELGIRHATGKPTIHVARMGTPLPFDNISHRTIFVDLADWHSIESGRRRLADSSRAINSPTFQVSNPITQANASFKMRESADPKDMVIAQIQDKLKIIESRIGVRRNVENLPSAMSRSQGKKDSASDVIYVDTIALTGSKGGVTAVKYLGIRNVGQLLDQIFYLLASEDERIEAFTYNEIWLIEMENGQRLTSPRSNKITDDRSLDEVSIYPGTNLRVIPVRHDWVKG
jgi:hypothetical protein